MAHMLFSRHSNSWDDFQQDSLSGEIRLSVFLIAAECFGLPALVWALHVLYHHQMSGGRILALVIMLLPPDLLELLLNPYIVTTLLQNKNCWETSTTCRILTCLWSGSMIYGFLLQQVVALEDALSLRHPHCFAHVFFPSCSIITFIIAFICFFLSELLSLIYLLILILPVLLIITLSCIVTCRAQPHISDMPYRTKKPSSTVLALVTSTVILHVMFIILCILLWRYRAVLVMYFCLMSLRVITDPLLCVLVYRKDLRVQKERHAEHRKDIELTQIQSSDTPNTHTAQDV